MKNKRRQLVRRCSRQALRLGSGRVGTTLVEMTVVIGIAALMLGLAVPVTNILLNSFESESGAKSIINSAMASARAIASKEQRYAGIRFQKRYDFSKTIVDTSQYMTFIIYDTTIPNGIAGNLGCRAVEGIEPIKLPDSIGVMEIVGSNGDIDNDDKLTNKTTFSILFSPSGKLIIHSLWVRNKNGVTGDSSMDDIFNSLINVRDNKIGMFIQDNDTILTPGLVRELSQNSFFIYDTKKFKQAYSSGTPYSGYLYQLNRIYINPYIGTIINEK
jgi:type II secretory pathway pseudopilin PulG